MSEKEEEGQVHGEEGYELCVGRRHAIAFRFYAYIMGIRSN